MEIIIRQGVIDDFPSVLELVKELAVFEKAPGQVINNVDKMIEEQDFFDFFVATAAGEIVAVALYFFAYYTWVGKSLYLDDIYVKTSYRGRKIGIRLLKEIFKVAKKEKCNRVRWQVLNWNKDAIEFFLKLNVIIDDQWLNCDLDRNEILKVLE